MQNYDTIIPVDIEESSHFARLSDLAPDQHSGSKSSDNPSQSDRLSRRLRKDNIHSNNSPHIADAIREKSIHSELNYHNDKSIDIFDERYDSPIIYHEAIDYIGGYDGMRSIPAAPTIYELPIFNDILEIAQSDIKFSKSPNPKLLKYGFSDLGDTLDFMELTSNIYYKTGLNFDFDRSDSKSIKTKGIEIFGNSFDQTFAEFWEIINLFDLFNTDQHIYCDRIDILNNIVKFYNKKFKTTNKLSTTNKLTNVSLILKKFSDVDLEENLLIHLLVNNLFDLLHNQIDKGNMVIQLFDIQTKILVQIIYYLSTLYESSYLINPMINSGISNSKYLVLIKYRGKNNFFLKKIPNNLYLSSIINTPVPETIISVIQCVNSYLLPLKYCIYSKIKNYLDTKVYEGITYVEMIEKQNNNTNKWIDMFLDPDRFKKILDSSIQITSKNCNHQDQWKNLFNV